MAITAFKDGEPVELIPIFSEPTLAALEGMLLKRCSKCDTYKSVFDFGSTKRDGLRRQCKACHSAANNAWNRNNRDRCNAASARYRERLGQDVGSRAGLPTFESVSAQKKDWRRRNREKVRGHKRLSYERNPDAVKERVRRWRRANRDAHRAQGLIRRARQANAAGVDYATVDKIQARVAFYGGCCRYCGAENAACIDHRVPLARGGSAFPANLVPACRTCNCRKHAKTEREFLTLLRG